MIEKLIKENPYIWLTIEDFYPLLEKYNLSESEIKSAKLIQSSDLAFINTNIWIHYVSDPYHYVKNLSIPDDELKTILRDGKIDEIFKI